jgi:hypothetical protein
MVEPGAACAEPVVSFWQICKSKQLLSIEQRQRSPAIARTTGDFGV